MQDALGPVGGGTGRQTAGRAALEAQRAAILAEAVRRGWHPVDEIDGGSHSGEARRRSGIRAAREAVRQERAHTLVVARRDRLARTMLDFAGILDEAIRYRWALVALDLGVGTDTSGEQVANVRATFAQAERRHIAQRTRDALLARKAQGVQLGRPRLVTAETVSRILEERAGGRTLAAIADGLNVDRVPTAQGGRAWYPSTVRAVLQPGGSRVAGSHPHRDQGHRTTGRTGATTAPPERPPIRPLTTARPAPTREDWRVW